MDIILKVARQVVAEKLTKNWLMAVRRGWLSLLKPSIHDFGDVLKAMDKLGDFIDRLQQQTRYVRRGPLSSLSGEEGQKLDAAFKAIREVLKDQRERATYWKEYLDGTAISLQWGEDRSDDARKMLALYKEKFSDMLEGYVPTRGKGPGGKRSANILEYFDKILEILYADAKRITDHGKAHPEEELHTDESIFTEFTIGRMKIVVVDPKIKPGTISGYVQDLKTSYRLLQQAKLDSVWYGITFIVSDEAHTLTDVERAAYNRYGYDISNKAGDYSWKGDMVRIWDNPPITSVLLHELGHRHWYKGMSQSERAKFESIVKVKKKRELDVSISDIRKAEMDINQLSDEMTKAVNDVYDLAKQSKDGEEFLRKLPAAADKVHKTVLKTNDDIYKALIRASNDSRYFVPEIDDAVKKYTGSDGSPEVTLRRFCLSDSVTKYFKETESINPQSSNFQVEDAATRWVDKVNDLQWKAAKAVKDILRVIEKLATDRLDENDPRQVAPVSTYGETNIDEAFAEVFMHYVMRKDITRDQMESFKYVMKLSSQSDLSTGEHYVEFCRQCDVKMGSCRCNGPRTTVYSLCSQCGG